MHVDIWVTLGSRTPDILDDVVEKVIDKDGCVGEVFLKEKHFHEDSYAL